MALNDGSVNDGDGNRILEYLNYFPPNFREYMLRELKWSRFKPDVGGVLVFGWVFWSQVDHQTLPHDNFIPDAPAGLNVKDKIRHALQKSSMLHGSLLQFWAPTTTMEGRTLLRTQNQPFALSRTTCMSDRQGLCDYRLVSTEYQFYADAESGEEELGLPGRVFLQKIPESAPSVKYYSEKEYPQRVDALRCNINGSWALPVFEHSSNTCVGVLEIVSLYYSTSFWHDKYFLHHLYDIFQEFGLQFFDGYTHCRMRYRNENKALTAAFRELRMVFGSVCKIHKVPLALTWVSCSSCNDLLPVRLLVKGVEYFEEGNGCLTNFLEVSKGRHLRKGQVTGRILPFPSLLYCSDIKNFSIAEYPFLPYARQCKLSGWFAICLQSIYPGNEVYILEFFLPVRSKNDENILTTLSLILGTMEEHFETFKLASGQELGEVLPLEVIDFQNGQKSHSVHMIQATRISRILELVKDGGLMLQLGQLDQPSMDAINNGMNVVSEAQNYNLPSLETLQNGKVAMQPDSSKHPSMDPFNIGQNVITPERNIIAITSLEELTRKTQERELTKTGVRIEISLEDILKCSKMSRNNAAQKLEVSISTLRRVCRGYGIDRWPPRNIKKVHSFWPSPIQNQGQTPQLNYDLPLNQASTSVVLRKPGFQDAHMLTIRAKYVNSMIKFRLSLSSRLVVLQQEVAKRLNLDPGTYNVKYVDEEDELILIACDEDLQDCMHTSRSLGNTSIVVQLEPKQPFTPVITCLNTAPKQLITPVITCLNTAQPVLSNSIELELVASNDNLLTEILVRLPVKSIARFKCVSKHWRSLLASISGCVYCGGIGEHRPSTASGADSGQVSEHSKVTKEQTLEQIQVSPKEVQSKQSCSTRSTKVQMPGTVVCRAVDLTSLTS